MKLPFRMKFWVLGSKYLDPQLRSFKVFKSRTGICEYCYYIVDGPFDSQEDAAHALAFWRLQDNNLVRKVQK